MSWFGDKEIVGMYIGEEEIFSSNRAAYVAHNGGGVERRDYSGELIWNHETPDGGTAYDVSVTPRGLVLTTGGTDEILDLLDTDGAVIERKSVSEVVESVFVDTQGNVWAGDRNGDIIKYDLELVEEWTNTDHPDTVEWIDSHGDGHIWSASNDFDTGPIVKKIDPDGTELETYDDFDSDDGDMSICVDVDGNCYIANSEWDSELKTIRKIDSSGNLVWDHSEDANHGYGPSVDLDGSVYFGGWESAFKIDSNGNLVWSNYDLTSTTRDTMVDPHGFLWTTGWNSGEVHKIDAESGDIILKFVNSTDTDGQRVDVYSGPSGMSSKSPILKRVESPWKDD